MHSLLTPAATIGFEDSNTLAETWWNHASAANWTGQRTGQRGLPFSYSDWSWPIYDAADATTRLTVRRSLPMWDQPARWTAPSDHRTGVRYSIPWNPSWRQATAEDGGILIRDGANWWGLLNLRDINAVDAVQMNVRCWWEADWAEKLSGRTLAVNPGDKQADGLGLATPANIGKHQGRGIGNVPKHVGILTADMLANGVDQAISIACANIQFGAGATFRAPATRVEHTTRELRRGTQRNQISAQIPEGPDPRMIPAGLRLVLNRPAAAVTAWVESKPPGQRRAAANFAAGLTDYGFFQGETGDGDCQIECEGIRNPKQAAKFAALGLRTQSDFAHFADGLITGPGDLRVVKAAA